MRKLQKPIAQITLLLSTVAAVMLAGPVAHASDIYCIATDNHCDHGNGSEEQVSTLGGGDSFSGFSLNPAATPTRDAIGLAAIYYKIRPRFLFVKGTGRIGAAVSPSNGDDTFFGNPSFETRTDYLSRRQESRPFEQTKIALGLAASIFDNEGTMWTRLQGSVGLLGRFVQASNHVLPGIGVSFITGPLQLSAAITQDETGLNAEGAEPAKISKDQTSSVSLGLPLGNVLLDYTKLNLTPEYGNPLNVDLANVSVLIGPVIVSAAYRIEKSDRPGYDAGMNSLITKPVKEDIFASVQCSVFSFSQVGLFYNYFLLNEVSAGVTVFF